ncbi:PREDICTED: protein FAR-RED ELONGATED HYPOCOTYL 1-like isoform X1 [Camelina sativa]|uniref:Protein FAR-RED ELONGATED HYPOCOTYL 1-like isoform X1 n=1 Tax=Camelina sativa TaxID=90675 RepID=A0ABM0YSU6_CAMSA|nr:PREDICTED: protein FAR-RED ELONGATED HYPOCOTYL 1-like isoform X1 [Camelina sativa]
MPEVELVNNNEKPSEISRFHHMIISSSKNALKMETVEEVSKKRKFQTDQTELSLLPLSKHVCLANVACSDNTNGGSEIDTEYSMSYVNSTTSMDCNNDEAEMKEESSGSCRGEEKMTCLESHLDFIYGTQKLEDYSEKDIENILYLDDEGEEVYEAKGCSNAAKFVLSSGRWPVNQADSTLHDTKKPTIDQEFEQYFSTLML